MTKGVYAGSFDPPTDGHIYMIEEGTKLFHRLVVAIGLNPNKKERFTLEERLEMLRSCTNKFRNVKVDHFPFMFLVDYAETIEATHILRGIRSIDDLPEELDMCHYNSDFDPDITTVFIAPPPELIKVKSSDVITNLIGPKNWEEKVRRYVPEPVYKKILEKYKK